MALNRGEGAELFSPISITIFGGLLVSTLLTLLIVPSLYSLIDDASVWTRKKLHR
jgi:HAE1 family hydrophobic/amphiphilic exporter-1